ncbi:dTDP-4-amino-4,6-dideoxygalactose transaminase [Falsiroseomonas sp. HW251]|uniref:dTDP-4-amino-4,6-dideoxygalactose transaminase n=1 Tax=Falsiroseomonas sp. HW251 TaxID=3390998 RepID=UPI003D317CA8
MSDRVPFNAPTLAGKEFDYIRQALERRHLAGNGHFSKACHGLISDFTGGGRALLTHSCTAGLEMAALLCDLGPGDEVLMPSFTFASTANAVVLRGAVPVFVDIRPDTLNIDETLLEAAVTPRTRAVCVVHYAGVACDMEAISAFARRYGLLVIEDAAQALHATWKGRPLGGFGDFAALSFHETKNVIAGEGGALVVNNPRFALRAEIIWEKGTNRAQFYRGEISRYTWVDLGSSFLPSEVTAAFLLAQLEQSREITRARLQSWNRYHAALAPLEQAGRLRRPLVPAEAGHNGHIYYVLARSAPAREAMLARLGELGVSAVIHYVPLHSAPAGLRFARTPAPMPVTDDVAARLVRLPMHLALTEADVDRVVAALGDATR